MDAATFERVTGVPPEADDLERANCAKAGTPGHRQCGICVGCEYPRFVCRCASSVLGQMLHFYRPVRTEVKASSKAHSDDRETAVRLYCCQAGSIWNIQVRGPEVLASGREGKAFMIATGTLEFEDLVALRDAIDAEIEKAGGAHR